MNKSTPPTLTSKAESGAQAVVSTCDYPSLLARRGDDIKAQLSGILATAKSFVWEVGCGHGHFLTAYAAAHPDRVCIGVDIASDRIERGVRKRDRAKLPNLHFIRAEARLFLQSIPPGRTISDVFILFPDPWPKSRHHKHRILQPSFLTELASRIGERGHLFFRTDYRPYFDEARTALRDHPSWQTPTEGPWAFEHETVFQSRALSYSSLASRIRDQQA